MVPLAPQVTPLHLILPLSMSRLTPPSLPFPPLPQVLSLPGRQSVASQELVFLSPILAPMALTHLLLYKLQEEQAEEEQEWEEEEEYTLGRAGGLEVVGSRDSKGLWVRDSLREVQLEVRGRFHINRSVWTSSSAVCPIDAELSIFTGTQ